MATRKITIALTAFGMTSVIGLGVAAAHQGGDQPRLAPISVPRSLISDDNSTNSTRNTTGPSSSATTANTTGTSIDDHGGLTGGGHGRDDTTQSTTANTTGNTTNNTTDDTTGTSIDDHGGRSSGGHGNDG